jgi:guanylate kinase
VAENPDIPTETAPPGVESRVNTGPGSVGPATVPPDAVAPPSAAAPLVIVLSGPGGVGKGTIARRLVAADPGLWLSRSWTTRARRGDDAEDAYVYVDRSTFETHLGRGGFLEHNEFLGNYYGTPLPIPPQGCDVLLEIDVNGAQQVHHRVPGAVLLFVDAPTVDEQRARLVGRGDPPEKVAARLAVAAAERAIAHDLGCELVINDDLEHTVAVLLGRISVARARRTEPSGGVTTADPPSRLLA